MLIKEKIAAADNRPSGFDYMRLALALSVVGLHFATIDYGATFAGEFLFNTWRRPFAAIVLPMFFSLSGFLVAGSLLRSKTLFAFIGLRVCRIVPALAVEILLCAFILGPIFTTIPLSEYFADRLFYRYFFNIIGHVQFLLPGVFPSNPHPNVVNEQLWTIPWELRCYILIAAMSLMSVFRSRVLLIVIALVFNAAVFCNYGLTPPDGWVSRVAGFILIEAFLAGIVVFVFSDKLPHSRWFFLLSLIATVALLLIPRGDFFVSFPAAYVTVYLGLLNPPRNQALLRGDYSYGIYLYGFPIQQAIAYVNDAHRCWYIDVLYVLPLTLMVAVASWWLVEKPTLSLRKYLPVLETAILRAIKSGAAVRILQRRPDAPNCP
jgi:peptidoglycan/LPS O-acetylase OafA/YrhL